MDNKDFLEKYITENNILKYANFLDILTTNSNAKNGKIVLYLLVREFISFDDALTCLEEDDVSVNSRLEYIKKNPAYIKDDDSRCFIREYIPSVFVADSKKRSYKNISNLEEEVEKIIKDSIYQVIGYCISDKAVRKILEAFKKFDTTEANDEDKKLANVFLSINNNDAAIESNIAIFSLLLNSIFNDNFTAIESEIKELDKDKYLFEDDELLLSVENLGILLKSILENLNARTINY